MSFRVDMWAMNKRPNSTKQPDINNPHNGYDCTLRGPCSIMAPVLEVNYGNSGGDPIGYNYCYIAKFDRFYWIDDWVNDGPLWISHCREDELATWKTAIGSSVQYILRSSNDFDGDVIDNMYPCKADTRIEKSYGLSLGSVTGGWYILGIQNDDSGAQSMGSSRFYACTYQGLQSIMAQLFNTTSFTGFVNGDANLTDNVYKSLFNPIEYITTCMFVPFQPAIINDMLTSLPYGYWSLNNIVNTYRVDIKTVTEKKGSFNLIRHPFAESRGNYVNSSPFTRYTLVFQPFGQITIDPSLVYTSDDNKVYYRVVVDPVSGVGILELSVKQNAQDRIFHTQPAQVGVPVSISQMSRDYMGFATSTLGAIGGAASSLASGNIPGVFGSAAAGVASAVESMIPQIQTQGASGSFAAYYATQPYLEAIFLEPVASDNDDLGRPLCRKGVIQNHPGFLMIRDPDLQALEANRTEMDNIRAVMASGFFYE